MGSTAVLVEQVTKSFGDTRALDGLDLAIEAGTVFGLLGPNGAGKTTTVRMLATLLTPDSGRLVVEGHDVVTEPEAVRRILGLTGQFAAVDESLTGRENLVWFARLRGMTKQPAVDRATELLDTFDLAEAADRRVKTYSGGMRRRLDLAVSLVVEPSVLVLDEPTTGLDPRSRFALWDVVRGLRGRGVTVVLTTQYLEEADQLADRIAVVDHGTVVAEGTARELKRRVGGSSIEVVAQSADEVDRVCGIVAGIATKPPTVDRETFQITAPVADGVGALAELAGALQRAEIVVEDVGLRRPSLDDVFLALTGATAHQGSAESGEEPVAGAR